MCVKVWFEIIQFDRYLYGHTFITLASDQYIGLKKQGLRLSPIIWETCSQYVSIEGIQIVLPFCASNTILWQIPIFI